MVELSQDMGGHSPLDVVSMVTVLWYWAKEISGTIAGTIQEVKLTRLIHLYKYKEKDQEIKGKLLSSINSLWSLEEIT